MNAGVEDLRFRGFSLKWQPIYALTPQGTRLAGLEALLRRSADATPASSDLMPKGTSVESFFKRVERAGELESFRTDLSILSMFMVEAQKIAEANQTGSVGNSHSDDLFLSLNISPLSLACKEMCQQERLIEALKETSTALQERGARLHIEVRETHLPEAKEAILKEAVGEIRKFGAHVSVDDFGVAGSGISRVAHMECDALKLDRSLTGRVHSSKKVQSVLYHISQMCFNLGIDLVAEGVEFADQVKALKLLGINLVQGFYFSEAKSLPEVLSLLSHGDRDWQDKVALR